MSLQVCRSRHEWQKIRSSFQAVTVGFVPTMGALHDGHISLVERCRQDNQKTVVSLFVNPVQFDNKQDLDKYPKTFEQDLEKLKKAGCDWVFSPLYEDIYPDHFRFQMHENKESLILCGAARPGHFDGVLTVVLKLFQIVRPHRAYFGEKDFQQLRLIKDMVDALFLNIEIIGCPIVRELDGLAMSSRNLRLSAEDRRVAPLFYKTLKRKLPLHEIRSSLQTLGFRVDYVQEHWGRRFGAVYLGEVRLIDNVEV